MNKQKIENILYTLLVIIGCIAVAYYMFKTHEEEKVIANLEVEFIDVGQAESILIRQEDHNVLIDAGNNKDGKLLVKYLKDKGIKKFDYVIGTHPHEDHIGGLDNIINEFDIEHILMPDVTTNSKTFEEVLDSIENKKMELEIPKIDETFEVGDLLFTTIYTGTNEEDLNASSIILRMDYKDSSYLFTGDTTSEIEETLLDKNLDVKVLKASHHGSTYSNSYDFLEKVTPEFAVISCGKDNEYYYPHIKAVNRIKKHTKNVYVTAEKGTIIFKDDGENIEVINEKTNTDGG
jgi:competence protein ComEC